jgi:hypothetical protein
VAIHRISSLDARAWSERIRMGSGCVELESGRLAVRRPERRIAAPAFAMSGVRCQRESRLSSRSTARLLEPRVIRASNLPFTPTFDPERGGPPLSLTTESVPVSSLTW